MFASSMRAFYRAPLHTVCRKVRPHQVSHCLGLRSLRCFGTETDAIVMRQIGDVDVLEYGKTTLRDLEADELLVLIAGAGVNPIDTYIRKGIYAHQPDLPFTPGLEGSGSVAKVGSAVDGVNVGDRVAFTVTTADGGFGAMSGSYAKHAIVKASLAMPVPAHLDLAAAASVPIGYLAAHRALVQIGRLNKGDRILVRGASGSVGLAVVHLARFLGAGTIVGTATEDECSGAWGDRILKWGATQVVPHPHEAIAPHGPFDLIIEQMARFNLESDVRLLAPCGRVVIAGSPPQADGRSVTEIDCRELMVKEVSIRGLFLWKQTKEERQESAKDIFAAFQSVDEAPPVHKMPLTEAKIAHGLVDPAAGSVKSYDGKIVLIP